MFNLMGPPSYMRPVVDRNVVMRRMTVKRGFSLQNEHHSNPATPNLQAESCKRNTTQNQSHQISNTQRTENKTTDVVIQ